jgi:hypothetical protein
MTITFASSANGADSAAVAPTSTILIVDDEPFHRKPLDMMSKREGYANRC